jgi:hypothetical protein
MLEVPCETFASQSKESKNVHFQSQVHPPRCLTQGPDTGSLNIALKALNLEIDRIGQNLQLKEPVDWNDVRLGVGTAAGNLERWMDSLENVDDDVHDALGILTLTETALASGQDPSNGQSISPTLSALQVVRHLLKGFEPLVPGSAEDLDRLMGYQGSIAGTPVDEALDEQRDLIHQAQAVISCANEYISYLEDEDNWRPQRALDAAFTMLDGVQKTLDASNLEDRGLAIARAKSTESAEAMA